MRAVPTWPRRLFTLALLARDSAAADGEQQVLLGLKKRGFGVGKWNGFGGKVEATDASIVAAAAREVLEEAKVHVRSEDFESCGVLLFSFEEREEVKEVHVFWTHRFSGEPSESEEMKPQWYDVSQIPFGSMWADDKIWLPHVLSGKIVQGHFHFAANEDFMLDYELEVSTRQVTGTEAL